jgi:hypothetical protein
MAMYDPQMLAQQTIPDSNTTYTFRDPEPNNITCMAGGAEMLKVGPDGFWVRGVKIPQDENEAESVYRAFKEFLTWSQLTRTY